VTNKTVGYIIDRGSLYLTKSIRVKFLTEKGKNITRTFFGISKPLTAILKRLLILDGSLEEIERIKV